MVARKKSLCPTRIWKFSARPDNPEAMRQILFESRRYYNQLVEIERARYGRFVTIRRRYAPVLAALDDEWLALDDALDALYAATKRDRQTHYRETGERRRFLSDEMRAEESRLQNEKKRVSAEAKEHRMAFAALIEPARVEYARRTAERGTVVGEDGKPRVVGPRTKSSINDAVRNEMLSEAQWSDVWKDIARSDDDAHRAQLAARAACGLSTGTYLMVEESFARAKKDSAPRPPRFRRFDGSGKISVQLRDATYSDALRGTTALSIRPAPAHSHRRAGKSLAVVVELDQSVPRGDRRRVKMTAMMHRTPPPDAEIKWASLLVRKVGSRPTYELQLTLEHESFSAPKRPVGAGSEVHVRIGWARVDGGVRVAHWPGGEVVVLDDILGQNDYAASVRSAADVHFERAKKLMRRWMRGGQHSLTAWHRMQNDHARTLFRHACMSFADYTLGDAHATWKAWRADRLSRGEDLYAPAWVLRRWLRARGVADQQRVAAFWAYTWARKDEHLLQLAADSLRRHASRRDAFFRREAIRIATEFACVTVDSYSIAQQKELPLLTLPGDGVRDQAQHNAHAAAPGRFREILREVMGSRCMSRERSSCEGSMRTARNSKGREMTRKTIDVCDAPQPAGE